MPMYEKGSVRAEPRSKQQERMKKIMKKFLSSLLALTMILSLVIVPANATDTGFTATAKVNGATASTARPGDVITFTASNPTVNVENATEVAIKSDSLTWKKTGSDTAITSYTVAANDTSLTFTGTARLQYKASSAAAELTTTGDVNANTGAITVTAFSESDVDKYTLNKREYNSANDIKYLEGEDLTKITVTLKSPFTDGKCTYDASAHTLKVDGKHNGVDVTFTINLFNPTKVDLTTSKPTIQVKNNSVHNDGSNYIRHGEKGMLEASYNSPLGTAESSWKYQWKDNGVDLPNGKTKTYDLSALSVGDNHSITVTVTDGADVTSAAYALKVKEDPYTVLPNYNKLTMVTGESQILGLTVKENLTKLSNPDITKVNWSVEANKSSYATLSSTTGETTTVTAGTTSGNVKITAVVTFKNKDYTVVFPIKIEALDETIAKVTNGDYNTYDDDELASLVAKIIGRKDSSFTASKVKEIRLDTAPGSMLELYSSSSFTNSNKYGTNDKITDLYISAKAGYLGEDSFKLKVYSTTDAVRPYIVTLKVPVVGDDTIKDTVTGTSANKEVTFTNDDYDYLYYSYTKPDEYKGHFDGGDVRGFEGPVKENKTVTVPASKFSGSNKTVTLYVVGVDSKGVASTGTITVSQKSYDITYNVVAGKSVTFDQKAFDSFLEDYAEDDGKYNPKKDEITFDHATLNSLPTAKSEGTLYYSGSEVTSSTNKRAEYTDMDKMTFEAVAKPSKDTVTLTFRVYGEIEKPNSRKPDKVDYYVNVVISVVKEDITYTVGIDDTVQLTARDFVNFLQDARTSYRKAELDYVKFDVSGKNVSSYAYGGLYRSYSSYSTGKLADSTDKFYYEPSRTQYDLADVAYHTTRWAEAGKTVYIPFTVYGTKNEEASGTMAITIAQTMNFIDVKASDFFYEPVKWAVNNKITNGTSSTTFSPYKNCNRAEIVTFLWRAAGTPEPTVTRNPFTDVNSVRDASYYKAILWASQKGITAGTNATTFSPYQECTRSQIVTFLYRYAGKPSGNYSNPFKDVSSVNEASYYNAILWAVGKGITQGTSTTTFSPYASCTRGEAVTFLYRYVNGVK